MPVKHMRDNKQGFRDPSEQNILYKTVTLQVPHTPSDTVVGWNMYHEQDGTDRPTILFFHENSGNLGLRLDLFSVLYHEFDCDVIAFAYRGYSDSHLEAGRPHEETLKEDAVVIMDYLERNHRKEKRLFLFGRSLGGGPGIYAAARDPDLFEGIILENTFTNMSDVCDDVFYIIKYFKWLVLDLHWDNISVVRTLKTPILLIAGEKDQITPAHHSERLYEAATQSQLRRLYLVPEGRHHDTWKVGGQAWKAQI